MARHLKPRHCVPPPTERPTDCLLSVGERLSYPLRRISATSVIPITGYQPYSATARLCSLWLPTAMPQPNLACPELRLPAPGRTPPDTDPLGVVPPLNLWSLSESHSRSPTVDELWPLLKRVIPRRVPRILPTLGSAHLRGEVSLRRLVSAL